LSAGMMIASGRLPTPLILMATAMGVAVLAGWIAVQLARGYYAIAPYHYDSAFYRMHAVYFHQVFEKEGMIAALQQSVRTKDSLDVTLRLLFTPRFLLHRFGHLAVLLPFLALFTYLSMWYVFTRTSSLPSSVATATFLFTFLPIHGPFGEPYIGGIADYWKDNLAT